MTAAECHLVEVLQGVVAALRDVGWTKEAAQVQVLVGPLDAEDAFDLLDRLGPELVRAYLRANEFYRRAPEAIRPDALVFTRNLFAARCHVAAARQAARRVLRGEAWLPN